MGRGNFILKAICLLSPALSSEEAREKNRNGVELHPNQLSRLK